MTSPRHRPRILAVSDVSLGYGSPEVAALMHDLCAAYDADGLLIEPDEPDRPPIDTPRPYEVRRVSAGLRAQSTSWRRHQLHEALKIVEAERPDVLVLFGAAVFPLLAALVDRPPVVLYHAYEQISELSPDVVRAHQLHLRDADLVSTPAVRRLIHDCARMQAWPRRVVEIYNAADVAYPDPVARKGPDERNGRFFWSGALDRRRTLADNFFDPALAAYEIDFYGRIAAPDQERLHAEFEKRPGFVHHGLVSAAELNAARANAAYSLVWWNPRNSFGHLHLASNRFFTAIQAGVPPICGPHPQCVAIAERYACAIVLEDWTARGLARGLARASDIFETDRYAALVQRCVDAAEADLGWTQQSAKLLDAIAAVPAMARLAA